MSLTDLQEGFILCAEIRHMEQLPESWLYDQGLRQEGGLASRTLVTESSAGEEAVSVLCKHILMDPARITNSDLFRIGADNVLSTNDRQETA